MKDTDVYQLEENGGVGDKRLFRVSDEAADGCFILDVPATLEEVDRWRSAERLWLRAQQEMRERYREAEQIQMAVDAVEEDLMKQEADKANQERSNVSAAREGLADQLDGSREWYVHQRVQEREGRGFRVHQYTVGWTIHHHACGIARRALEHDPSSFRDRQLYRLPEVAEKLLRGFYGTVSLNTKPIKTCRCAERVKLAAESMRREREEVQA